MSLHISNALFSLLFDFYLTVTYLSCKLLISAAPIFSVEFGFLRHFQAASMGELLCAKTFDKYQKIGNFERFGIFA